MRHHGNKNNHGKVTQIIISETHTRKKIEIGYTKSRKINKKLLGKKVSHFVALCFVFHQFKVMNLKCDYDKQEERKAN